MKTALPYIILLIVIGSFSLRAQTDLQKQASIDSVTVRIRNFVLSAGYTDPTTLINSMKPDGSWDSIDYLDQHSNSGGWGPNRHLCNLTTLAVAYKHPESLHYNQPSLLKKIVSGCDYVSRWPYLKDLDNWWWKDIGDPQEYMKALILIKGDITSDKIKSYSAFIKDQTDKASHQGQNRSSVSQITIYKGCIEDDFKLVMKGLQSMASILEFAPTRFPIVGEQRIEGIKADYSFHQHRRQLQPGSYGLVLITDLANSLLFASGTQFESAFTPAQRDMFSRLVREGHLFFSYRRTMDFGTRGRAITKNATAHTSIDEKVLNKLLIIDPENADTYTTWIRHLDGGKYPAPGNKYFWESEIMTHRGAGYYLSAKVISARTNGTERIHNENKLGYNLPLGATNIMVTGKEYDRIYPSWDWKRIPGTTSVQAEQFARLGDGYLYGNNQYAGGVSDGKSGIIAYRHDQKGLKANKAYFFMGDAMLCIGNGITAAHDIPVVTSVNQCNQDGIIHWHDGKKLHKASSVSSTGTIKWVHHGNTGYIFPVQVCVTVQGVEQTGTWKAINEAESDAPVTKSIFSTWINHGAAPQNSTYQYIIVPAATLNKVKQYARQPRMQVLRNDSVMQAVYDRHRKQYSIVFYTSATATLKDGLTVRCDKPCIMLLRIHNGEYTLSVADPTYSQTSVGIEINKALTGKNTVSSRSATATNIHVPLPQNQYTGSTVTETYR